MKQLRAFAVLLTLVSLASLSTVLAQPNFELPLTVTDGANTYTLYIGVFPGAHFGVDPADVFGTHAESELPPPPPTGVFDARMVFPRTGVDPGPPAGFGQGTLYDYRPYLSLAQADTFKGKNQVGTGTGIVVSWSSVDFASRFGTARIVDAATGGLLISQDMLTTSSADLGAAGQTDFKIFTSGLQLPPSPPPIFSANPTSFNFGNHPVGSNTTLTLTISNIGVPPPPADLILDAPPTVPAGFTVTPNPPATFPLNIAPGASHNFDVTFSPTVSGPFSGDIVFTHNGIAPGPISPTSIPVSGNALSQGGTLQFKAPARTHIENTAAYQDTLVLLGYTGQPLKALQLNIRTHSLLTIQSVSRGSDIPLANWSFNSYIVYDPPAPDGSIPATVHLVIYGNGNTTLPPGDYNDLVRFRYGVVGISPLDTQHTTISLENVHGSDQFGNDAQVIAGPDQNVTVIPRFPGGERLGDVNNDGYVDLLDLLMVVDHILTRHLLTPDEFRRADIAPWTPGQPFPTPDGIVNVQDLAVLQGIILTGAYPDGTLLYGPVIPPVVVNNNSGMQKGNLTSDVKLTFYMTNDGISVRMANALRVKGLQFEFGNVPSVPTNIEVTTLLGLGPYLGIDNLLRILMYNMEARVLEPGDRLVANIPFELVNPSVVTLNRFVVAGEANDRIQDVEIEIIHGAPPELPVDYLLSQNYPNPFNPTTNIKFAIPAAGNVKIAVYDLLGQEVRSLVNSYMDRGTNVVSWDGRDNNGKPASTGMYIYRMTSGSFTQSLKMMFVK